MDVFNCTSPYFTNFPNMTCNFGSFLPEDHQKFKEMYETTKRMAWAQCPLPCMTMDIYFGYPIHDITYPNEAYVKFYFKSTTHISKSILAYTDISLFAELGGYLGLLLGFSLLDLTKLVNFCYNSLLLRDKKISYKTRNSY